MRPNQWFVFAVVFLLTAIFLQYIGNTTGSASAEMTKENLRELMNVEEEDSWTETFGIIHLSKESSADTLFITSQIYHAFSTFSWSIFIACVICGWIEHRIVKKKK